MGNKVKRLLSLMLAILMVVSAPLTAFADNGTEAAVESNVQTENTQMNTGQTSSEAVVQNMATNKGYTDLTTAMFEAQENETIALLADVSANYVLIPDKVTLDLNQFVLEAAYVTCFGNLVDNSTENTGLLKVDAKSLLIQSNNKQLPVKTGEGYQFFELEKFNQDYNETKFRYAFQPFVEASAHEFIKQGAGTSGVTVNVCVSWTQANGQRSQEFVYNDTFVMNYLNSYKAATDKYSSMYTLRLANTANYEDLSFKAVVASETGVRITSEEIIINEKEESGNVNTDSNNQVTESVTLEQGQASAVVPAGTKVEENIKDLVLGVEEMDTTTSSVQLGEGEEMLSLDVHVEGVAADNTTPILVTINEIAPEFLNQGNIALYHVENGQTVEMTRVYTLEEVDAHNEFYYDIVTGTITMALASFSEVAVVSDTENAWNGEFDYSWYTNAVASVAEGESEEPYTIANADQLAAFGAIVGGMNGQTRDAFTGKTVKLLADINLGDAEADNQEGVIFYPIGYYNSNGGYEKVSGVSVTSNVSSFEGTFDGNGHTISNFYQNTWEMFGDYNDGYDEASNHYKDAMGLFGYVVNGTVKNLTVDSFSSDGEFTPTGVIAAYAVNSTFENIAITNCNPRVYNTGNGGIVGIGGNSDDPDTYKLTFTNITIDNSNKITALWGSWDVACGGLVGMFRGDGHVYMTNCHVAAQMDVYNDVCGNYQYYWYRYSGMMVGTNKNMTTDANGYTVPETDKFHAEGCTVHFGEWNDYYYCELVANSLASYTHDHQFSRLEEISSLDEIKSGDTWTKAGNFLLISEDTKTCYHIVKNTDGTLKQHLHTDEGYEDSIDENGDGNVDLKEDKTIVHLPFNQLFTGYGWGVKHIPVYNGDDYAFEGITILDREAANSVVKFEKVTEQTSYKTETTVMIGDLFKAAEIINDKLAIKSENVLVTVSPVHIYAEDGTIKEESTAGGSYVANTGDWTQGTLTFSGTGKAQIIITDYYFCTPTTIAIEITEPDSVDKFDLVFENTDDYLYRVGNANAVVLGSLFKAKDGVLIGNVDVEVTAYEEGTSVSGEYTANASEWTEGTIEFSGTGLVKVTIDDDLYANEKTLYLEVVNATNVTSYSELKNQNSVLLKDIEMSSGSSYYLANATLYGNNFKFDVTNGDYIGSGQISNNYLVCLSNASLDNIQIVGAVYTEYGAMASSNYNNPVVLSTGNSTITNCYISNCASPVRVKDGNLEIVNSTIKGGNFANIDIRGGHVVLDNVTTINQVNGNDTAEDGTVVVGLGIVFYYENVLSTTTVEIKNGITQYNHLSESQANKYITGTAQSLTEAMFTDEYSSLQYNDGNDVWVNTGIVSMTNSVNDVNISDLNGYIGMDASVLVYGQKMNGYVYTIKPDAESIAAQVSSYVTTGQGAIAPSYSFDYTTKNYVEKTDGSNDYCYEQGGTVYISMDAGESFDWDTSILTATKYNDTLTYTVSMNDTDYTGKSIAFSESGNYEVVYSYTDTNNYGIDAKGNIVTYEKIYTKTVHINVAVIEASAKSAEFTFGNNNKATEKITINNTTYISATGVTEDNTTWTYMTIDGQKIYYPIVAAKLTSTKGSSTYAYFPVFKNVVSITDYAENGTGDAFTYNSSTTTLPTSLTAVKGVYKAASDVPYWYNLTNSNLTQSGASKIFKWASSSDAPTDPVTYENVLCYKSPQISANRDAYITLVQYSYTDATNTTYYYYVGYTLEAFTKQNTCVTPDTLVTMADGTQKRVDSVSSEDEFLVWDFVKGEYASAPASILMNHGYDTYKVTSLKFEDGTIVKTINGHGFFHTGLREFIILNDENVKDYVGQEFLKQDMKTAVKLVDYSVEEQYTESWSILTAEYHNCIFEGMLALTPAEVDNSPKYLMPFTVGEDLKYDDVLMAADIEKYGLYTYEEFKDIITHEQFAAFNIPIFKVSVEKGFITKEEILYLLELYA